VPKWTVGGAGSAAETIMFDSGIGKNCRGAQFNKTHYYLNIDLLDPKRDCGTKRRSEGVQGTVVKLVSSFDNQNRNLEIFLKISKQKL